MAPQPSCRHPRRAASATRLPALAQFYPDHIDTSKSPGYYCDRQKGDSHGTGTHLHGFRRRPAHRLGQPGKDAARHQEAPGQRRIGAGPDLRRPDGGADRVRLPRHQRSGARQARRPPAVRERRCGRPAAHGAGAPEARGGQPRSVAPPPPLGVARAAAQRHLRRPAPSRRRGAKARAGQGARPQGAGRGQPLYVGDGGQPRGLRGGFAGPLCRGPAAPQGVDPRLAAGHPKAPVADGREIGGARGQAADGCAPARSAAPRGRIYSSAARGYSPGPRGEPHGS